MLSSSLIPYLSTDLHRELEVGERRLVSRVSAVLGDSSEKLEKRKVRAVALKGRLTREPPV